MDEPQVDATEVFYDRFWTGDVWSGRTLNGDEQQRLGAIRNLFETHRLSGRILDVGCGRGVITASLASYGAIVGIDVVAAAIEVAGELFPDIDTRCTTVGSLNETDAASFDVVVSTEVIEHVPTGSQAEFVSDVVAAMAPGGFLVMTTPRGELHDTWRRSIDTDQPVEDWLTEPELQSLLGTAGLEVIERRRVMVYGITWWRRPLQLSVVRRLTNRFERVASLVDRAGIYQVVLARKPMAQSSAESGESVVE